MRFYIALPLAYLVIGLVKIVGWIEGAKDE